MTYDKDEIKQLFNTLEKTKGVLHSILITNDSSIYTSSDQIVSNDAVELQIFMETIQFLNELHDIPELNFKSAHWVFENSHYSLYEINDNRLLIIHYATLDWEKFDTMIIDFLLTI